MVYKNVFFLGLVGFLTAFGAQMIGVGLPDLARRHGLTYAGMGMLLAVYNLAEIGIKPLAGYLADRIGLRPVMLWGTGVFAFGSLLFCFLAEEALWGIRFAQGLGAGALSVSSLALLVLSSPRHLGVAVGIYQALKGMGYVVAPLLGSLVMRRYGLAGTFFFAGIMGTFLFLGQLFLASWFKPAPSISSGRRRSANSRGRGRLWPWYLVNFTDTALLGILLGFLPLRADELGYPPTAIGLLLGATSFGFLLVQPLAGALADRYGRRGAILWGLTVGSLALGGVGLFRRIGLAAAGMLGGIGLGVAWTNSLAQVGEGAEERGLGRGLGLAGSCKDAGDIFGPLWGGFWANRSGLLTSFLLAALWGLLVTVVAAYFGREQRD